MKEGLRLDESQKEELRREAAAMGVVLKEEQIARFDAYFALLYEWNRRMNLTRIAPEQAVRRHFLDSLSLRLAVNPEDHLRLLDVGSGAGFPGIPLKIAFPHLRVTLLEASEKRVRFLKGAAAALAPDGLEVVHARAEAAAAEPGRREQYDLVAARAVAKLEPLAEMMLPFASVGGIAAAYESGSAEEAIEAAAAVIGDLGGRIERTVPTERGWSGPAGVILILRKISSTPPRYPRSAQYLARKKKAKG